MKKHFPWLILTSALAVSISAAYYSIYGLSNLFAGAYVPVIIMATTLEVSKLIIAASLHIYWGVLEALWKMYLIPALLILMVITSAGIYGYLSNAYQITYNKDLALSNKIDIISQKKQFFQDRKAEYDLEKASVLESISSLRESLGSNILQSVDKKTGNIITTTSKDNRKSYDLQLKDAIERRDQIEKMVLKVADTIFSLENIKFELSSSNDSSSELGPLKYISKLTGHSMDTVVNWFLLLLIGVFDPLAIILMVLALKTIPGLANAMSVGELPTNSPKINTVQTDYQYNTEINLPIQDLNNEKPKDIVSPLNTNNIPDNIDILPTFAKNRNEIEISKPNPKIISDIQSLPQTLSDKLKSILGIKSFEKKIPTLSDSQKKIMTHQEINEFYNQFKNRK